MKKIFTGITSLALVATVAGCGAAGANNTQTTGSGGSATKPVFTFGMSGEYPPFNYKASNGKLTGFDVAIGDALAKQMGMTPKPVTNPWDTIIGALNAGKFQAIIGSMGVTKKREKQVNFSTPYYKSGAQIFVRADNTSIKTLNDLKGKTIGVDTASTYATIAKQVTTKVHGYDSDVFALKDLQAGRLDAVITDKLVGEYAIKDAGLKLKPAGKPLTLDDMAVAVRKDEPQLLKKINTALKTIEANGTYSKISNQYFGENLLTDPSLQSPPSSAS